MQQTLIEVLDRQKKTSKSGTTFVGERGALDFLSYQQLYEMALETLFHLQRKGIGPRDEVVLQLEDNKAFVITFWACILGGIIPVPLSVGRNDGQKMKLFKVWPIFNNPFLIVSENDRNRIEEFARSNDLNDDYSKIKERIIISDDLNKFHGIGQVFESSPDDIALIQFSSGSTGNPKGIVLTHSNILVNIEAISKAASYTDKDSTLSWMPLTHDMGLIGFHLNPTFLGINQLLIPTSLFIRKPSIWMDLASKFKATVLCSPNFGYRYFLKHTDESLDYRWKLNHVRIIYNGAEPISEKLCVRFLETLSKYGLKGNSMCPVYGLAEASLAVSISGIEDDIRSLKLQRDKSNFADTVTMDDQGTNVISFVNVGKAIENCSIRITDNSDNEFQTGVIGNIQIKGKSVTPSYYNSIDETKKVLTEDGWLKTGDIGFINDGSLFVTGRSKDVIFSNGQNFYAHDVERIAEEVEGIELNKIVVAGSFNNKAEKEEVIAFVFHRGPLELFAPKIGSLTRHINDKIGLALTKVLPVKDVPRTTSGKLQRFELIKEYERGAFDEVELRVNTFLGSVNEPGVFNKPKNSIEEVLLEIWRIVLERVDIDVDHKFFEIGGNSLKAIEICMLLKKRFQIDISFEDLFKKQTIRQIADLVQILRQEPYESISRARDQKYYPLSSSQKRLYYYWTINKISLSYNIPLAFKIQGEFELGNLESHIRQLIKRHDALRIKFHSTEEPVFEVQENIDFNLDTIKHIDGDLDKTLLGLVKPFDLLKGPLWRMEVLKSKDGLILFIDIHHIISDGHSLHTFLKELLQLDGNDKLSPLPIQFRDFAVWEKSHLQSNRIQQQKKYWLDKLQDQLATLEMPIDFPRPVVLNGKGAKIEFEISETASNKLRSLAKQQECTLNVLIFTVYNLLLKTYTGQKDIAIGLPSAGRMHPDLQSVHGMFVNNLVIINRINGDELFTQLLESVKERIAEALKNQDYPFEFLIRDIAADRDMSRNPIFDTMFTYQNFELSSVHNSKLILSRHFFDTGSSKFDISLEVFDSNSGSLKCYFEYSDELFKRATVLRFKNEFENLINEVLENPDKKISEYLVLDGREYESQILEFNKTKSKHILKETIHGLFEAQVIKTPTTIAVEGEGCRMTYEQLNSQANQLAKRLKGIGIGQGSIVAILLPRSSNFLVGLLGTLKAGGCFLPIDSELPKERINYYIENSKSSILLTNTDYEYKFFQGQQPKLPCIAIDDLTLELSQESYCNEKSSSTPNDLAYIIYTSGTTSNPKGVMIEHKSLVNYSRWAAEIYVRDEEVVFPLFTSISFDLTITSIFLPLITGNKILILDENESEKTQTIEAIIKGNSVDVVKVTPSHLKLLIDNGSFSASASKIRRIIVGGEKLDSAVARKISNLFEGKIEIFNEYGPTEATVGCMIYQYNDDTAQTTVPIGKPIHNVQIYLLNEFLKPVPIGVHGELYISGDCLARGYLFNDEATGQKFIPNPYRSGQKMYKTGDVAKRLPSGDLEFVGRSDGQVKVKGYRIELSEIESHLNSHPDVIQSVVVMSNSENSQGYLVAYYRSASNLEESQLRNFLTVRLPHYMIPTSYNKLEEIPLTRNGKVDYNLLNDKKNINKFKDKKRPVHDTHHLFVKVWGDILREKDIGITDNFFELGGDSIKAVQIASRLFDMGVTIKAKDILTYHTIEQVFLHSKLNSQIDKYDQNLVSGTVSLTPITAWFFSRNFFNPNFYNQTALFTLHRRVNTKDIQKAFNLLIEHHDGLRINYDSKAKVLFYNNSHLQNPFKIEILDIDSSKQTFELENRLIDLKREFDIERSLLIKVMIIRDKSATDSLLITMHHLIIDGVSWRILMQDFYKIYGAIENGDELKLSKKTASLIDWANELDRLSYSEKFKEEAGYWTDVENTVFVIPQDFETSEWKIKDVRKISGRLNAQKSMFLSKGAHKVYKTDVSILLNVALLLTLRDWTGLSGFVVEQESNGRNMDDVDVSRTMGWFTSMYPVKVALKDQSLSENIKFVKEQMRCVPSYGIGHGVEKFLKTDAIEENHKLSEIRFNYLGHFGSELNNDLFSYASQSTGNDADINNEMTSKLEFVSMLIDGNLIFDINYNSKAHKDSTIEWFKNTFLCHLEIILEHIENEENLHFTPSDFQEAKLDEDDLDILFK